LPKSGKIQEVFIADGYEKFSIGNIIVDGIEAANTGTTFKVADNLEMQTIFLVIKY
jgi:hypothetical protein